VLRKFLENHVLANVLFVVVLIIGLLAYWQLPRSKDPEINFNWISIFTVMPGAAAEDVEKLITDPLEEAIQKIADIRFVSSNSREGISSILVRFNDISERIFDRRLNELGREIQNKAAAELPDAAEEPLILEITTANSFPSATLVVSGQADDETLRRAALNIEEDVQRIKGVDDVDPAGLHEPELHVEFFPEALATRGITPAQLADTIARNFRDTAAGDTRVGNEAWLVRVIGTDADPGYLAELPVVTKSGEIAVGALADTSRARRKPEQLVLYKDQPGVLLAVTKRARVNTLELVDRLREYIDRQNPVLAQQGLELVLLDDQTAPTREAIALMENNFLVGLVLVSIVTWIFLGSHIAAFIGIGIPFALAGTFAIVSATGHTLNEPVLLGVVIVLGMLVDDAVVVVEAIYYRMQRGVEAMQAAVDALRETFAPVTSSVLTTIAAFMPLMLMPGILGKFLFIVPFVVSVALAISLIEAYWMLPVHVTASKVRFDPNARIQRRRIAFTHWLRITYSRLLVRALRHPIASFCSVLALMAGAGIVVAAGWVHTNLFAGDPLRIFYVNVQMPPGTPLEQTLRITHQIERKVRSNTQEAEVRAMASVAGQMFTETEPFFGDQYGQVTVTLHPRKPGMRTVHAIVDALRKDVLATPGPTNISFLIMAGGPPVSKPINIKVRGDDYSELRAAADALRTVLNGIDGVRDISDDDSPGKRELRLQLDGSAVRQAGLDPADVARSVRLLFDGDIMATMQHQGEKLEVRVRAKPRINTSLDDALRTPIALPTGGSIPLGQLVVHETAHGRANIRHYNFRRTITVEADVDKAVIDTVAANNVVKSQWNELQTRFPAVSLDFTGELDDINESLDSMLMLFVLGVGLMYLILGTQFKSYWQPLMILITLPLAFTGVVYGLAVSRDPLSLFTLYGVVALAGIAVNAAIVMIDAANDRLYSGMSVQHAAIYAARRRLIPILITSLTTIAGLLSLALGIGGRSAIWSPVASAIVWGLLVSTALTLFVIPLLYRLFMARTARRLRNV